MDESDPPKETPEESTHATPSLVHERVLQPSAQFVEEMKVQKETEAANAPVVEPRPEQLPTNAEPPFPQPLAQPAQAAAMAPSPYPNPTHGPASAVQQPTDEYDPSHLKVCERAPSLKLFAIVDLVLSLLGFMVALVAVMTLTTLFRGGHTSSSIKLIYFVSLIADFIPLIGSIFFLITKNVTLVKAFLIILLVNYGVSLVSYFVNLATTHFANITSYIFTLPIAIFFLVWTWSVFTDVNALES